MAKSSRTHLEKCVNIILEQLQTTQGEALSMGFVSPSKRADIFVEMVLQQNGYDVLSFDCNYYTKGNEKPQLMSFFTQVRDQIREQAQSLKNPVILFRNTSFITYHEEDKFLMISAIRQGLNLDDESFFHQNTMTDSSSYVNADTHTHTHTHAESSSGKTFIPLFSVTRNELPGEEHYRKIIYPNGDRVNNNPYVKKIWEQREALKTQNSAMSDTAPQAEKEELDTSGVTKLKNIMMPLSHGKTKIHGKILHDMVSSLDLKFSDTQNYEKKEKPASHKHMLNIAQDMMINSKLLNGGFMPGGFLDTDSQTNTELKELNEEVGSYIDNITSEFISKATKVKELKLDSTHLDDTMAAIDALKKNKYKYK